MNVVLLRGSLSSPPRIQLLPSGDRLGRFEVTTHDDAGTHTVPVVVLDPPASATALEAGAAVVAAGVVRRRFFRAGGVTRSATEVVADRLVPARHAKRARRVVDEVGTRIGSCDPATDSS